MTFLILISILAIIAILFLISFLIDRRDNQLRIHYVRAGKIDAKVPPSILFSKTAHFRIQMRNGKYEMFYPSRHPQFFSGIVHQKSMEQDGLHDGDLFFADKSYPLEKLTKGASIVLRTENDADQYKLRRYIKREGGFIYSVTPEKSNGESDQHSEKNFIGLVKYHVPSNCDIERYQIWE